MQSIFSPAARRRWPEDDIEPRGRDGELKMDWTNPPHDWFGLWVLNHGDCSGITSRFPPGRGLGWKESLQTGIARGTEARNGPVYSVCLIATHDNSAVEQDFASALAKPSPSSGEFEMPPCRS